MPPLLGDATTNIRTTLTPHPDQVSPSNIPEPKNNEALDTSVIVVEPQNDKILEREKVPYLQILASPTFWGIMIVAFGDTIGYHVFLLYGPIYINKVLGFEVTSTGILAAFPYIFSIVTKALGGVFLDRASCIKERLRVLLFVSLSQAAMTLCFVALLFITPEMAFIGQTMLTLMTVFSGMAFVGVMSASQIISQQLNYIVTSALAIQDSLAGLAVPVLVAVAAPHYDKDEWILVFQILIGLLAVTNLLFIALTKVKPAKWTQ
uniref:MFS domain-containing protein n=1 Tax=Steinernema glaseri TaxID=37863 RepID=A0A1I7Y3U8_9BILA